MSALKFIDNRADQHFNMKRLMILGAVWALAVAKPGLYKEKEDFQFSRSSSDDGTKSGFYGAQRGNMGGNYERAHNMDSLAQNQMSGLVKQVEGELGDGANMRSGSVYTAANSRGTYGSGHFDLSNLAGRNFQETFANGDSQSQSLHSGSSAYNTAYANTGYQSSRHNGYQAAGYSGQNVQTDDLQALTDHSQRTGHYDYGRQTSQVAGYNAQSGFQQQAAYDASNTNLHSGSYGSDVHTRLISGTPVRIIVRPGTRVTIPVAAQTYDQNSLNSDAEVISNDNQRTVYRVPTNAKHYESSYNYRKEWEKHDTIPATVLVPTTTDNPFPTNSEFYEDGQVARAGMEQHDTRRVNSQRAQSTYGGYNAAVKSTSGQSRFNYDTQRTAASQTNANAYSVAGYGNHETSSDSSLNGYNAQSQYNAGRYHAASADALTLAAQNRGFVAAGDLNSQYENLNTKPKSYQSAYSYHKSWERQGDPYVIKPASGAYYDGQASQRLTGSHYQHSHASGADCDENGHLRVARSYNTDQFQDMQQQSQNLEDLGQQQSQNLEDFGQQQSQNLEDFGQQQSQNLEDFGQQQSQNLEGFGQQQSQNLENFGQEQQSQNLEDLGQQQQSQNLEDFGQQQQSQNLEDFGQQQQSQNFDYFSQQQQSQNLENLGQQQSQQNLEDLGQKLENLGQQTQVQWESQQEAGQQTQNTWDNLENLSQQTHNKWDDMQHTWDKFETLEQKPQANQNGLQQRPQDIATDLKNNTEDQQAQDKWGFNFKSQDEQQIATAQENVQSNTFNQQETQSQQNDDIFSSMQQSQKHNNDQMSVWDKFDTESDQNMQQHNDNSEQSSFNGNPVNWSFVSQQVGLDQQPLNSGSNPESQSVYHNVNNGTTAGQITSTTQSHKTSDTNEQSNTGTFDFHDGHFNTQTNQNQFWNEHHSFQETHNIQQSNHWYFSNGSRQEQTTNTDSSSHAFDTISPNTAPLSSLWDKLGNFEQTLVSSKANKDETNAFSQEHTNTQNSYANSMNTYHNIESISQEHLNNQMKPNEAILPTTEKDTSQNKLNETGKETSQDVGRGDIGPEDVTDFKLEKYPTDIPESSETVQNQNVNNISNKNLTNTQNNNQDVQHHGYTHGQHYFHQHNDFEGQNDAENTEQQNLHVFSLHETVEQPNEQNPTQQHNLEQHNVQDYVESVEQENQKDFTQQENQETILSDFEKQDNFEQQNVQDFGQQVNLEQHGLQDFGKPDNTDQQNLHDFGKQDNLEQQNLQDFGQQVNLEQQNLQDFGQQVNLEQQNLQDFGQQVNLEQQNLQDFGQQVNLEQQNLQDFGQQVNLEQQNLQDFEKHDGLQQQNLQDFGQQAYLEQHNLQSFGSQGDLQNQNRNLEQLSQNPEFKYSKEERTALPKNNVHPQTYFPPPEEIEEPIVKKQSNDLHSISAQTPSTEVTPIEPVTESTGFWKSVGNKFSRAKSKIASWF
ncbi:hypothetical protein PYW07_003274 [Mythimna separata]|uniref:Uncharacterized protein n=1 Tax=Mythimna separata TaxID=271217 RepID=A0AAD7YHT6_MYTSE|nr:hypothetical protein PYW07_003274 [Mythimna separata]